jgi:small subunit ribosomal protein S6
VIGLVRKYEALYIVRPDVDGGHEGVVSDYQKFIVELKGSLVDLQDGGSRNFAYPVEKFEKGNYVLFTFQLAPEMLPELESRFKLDDRVLRYQVVRLEEEALSDREALVS